MMKINRSSLAPLAISTLLNLLLTFTGTGADASATAQVPPNNRITDTADKPDNALISINNKLHQIPLGHQVIHTDIIPPPLVTSARVIDGPPGFGCFFSQRGNRPLGTFTVGNPIPQPPLPPKAAGEAERSWPPIANADTLTCYRLADESYTYLVWLLHDIVVDDDDNDDGVDGFAIDPTTGIRQTNGNSDPDSKSRPSSFAPSITPSNSPREELVFVRAGSMTGAEDFAAPGRPVVRAMLVDAPFPQSVCLLQIAPVLTDEGGSLPHGRIVELFDLMEVAEVAEGRLTGGLRCFRGW